jgi:hypothetical protein
VNIRNDMPPLLQHSTELRKESIGSVLPGMAMDTEADEETDPLDEGELGIGERRSLGSEPLA